MKNIIKDFNTLGIIGLAKNTGKTTTLNAIIDLFSEYKIGLTSIGLDGEELDQVNFLPKPKIEVKKGMVIATASACLDAAPILYKVITKTNLFTALGPIKIIEVLSKGHLVVAGPTTNSDLKSLIELMKPYVDKVLIDGAFNRMTFSNIDLIEGIILATGAIVHPSMDKTIEKTKAIVDAFHAPKSLVYDHIPSYKLAIHTQDAVYLYHQKNYEMMKQAIDEHARHIESIYIQGAITPKLIDLLIAKRIENIDLVCDDPTKLLLSEIYFKHIKTLKINLHVIHSCKLIAVTINPFSPNGQHYDEDEFLKRMKDNLFIPVFNVLKMEVPHV